MKYSNLFWHEGVRIFEERMLETAKGQLRIRHLENDVTKALLNVFEHGSDGILRAFLRLVGVRDAPASFQYDFQVTDTEAYRQQPRRMMLSIIADSTQVTSNPRYRVDTSRPDGCIFNERSAILIEVKTQSPLVEEQIEGHIRGYLGSATERRTITWEDISDAFRQLLRQGKTRDVDRLLLTHFLGLLELLGIARFNGFADSDFAMQDVAGRIPDEEFLDFRRQFMRKAEKFTEGVYEEVRDAFPFRALDWYPRRDRRANLTGWTALYFHDGDPGLPVNHYPNINFNFHTGGIELSLNGEVRSSLNRFLAKMKADPDRFDALVRSLPGMHLAVYFKMQYRPQDHFRWKFLPGYPVDVREAHAVDILTDIDRLKQDWEKHRRTMLFEMENGLVLSRAGRPFTANELEFALARNPRANFAFRIEKRYPAADVVQMKKHVIRHIAKDVRKTAAFMRFVVE